MISVSVARKYAKALLRIGLKENNHEVLGRDLEKFSTLLEEDKMLRGLLFNIFYRPARRKAMARQVGEFLGLSKSSLDFLDLLIERERMDHFPAVVKAYQELSDQVSNRVRAQVISAEPLSPALVAEIKNQLENSTGKSVILTTGQDPSLIGGVVTRMGNVIYDGSLRTQLLKAKENLYKE